MAKKFTKEFTQQEPISDESIARADRKSVV